MKKVKKSKRAGLSLLVAAMIFVELFMAGCGKTKGVTNNAQDVPAASASNLPEGTPDSTAVPTQAVDPEVLETAKEAEIEDAALAYYNRLSAIPGYPNNYEKVLDMTKRLNHRFNLEGIGTQTELENYAMSISLFLMDFTNTIIYNDGVDDSKNLSMDVDSEKIFPNANENEKALLKVVEDLGSKVYTSRRTDREAFEKNSRLFLSLMAKIYFSETSSEVNWEGTMIPDFESMDMFVDEVIRYYGIGYLTIIANDPQGKNFTAIDNECFTAAILIQRLLGGITCDTISIIAENSSQEIIDDVKIAKERTLGLAPTSKP